MTLLFLEKASPQGTEFKACQSSVFRVGVGTLTRYCLVEGRLIEGSALVVDIRALLLLSLTFLAASG